MAGTTDTHTLLPQGQLSYSSKRGTRHIIQMTPPLGIYLKKTKCQCEDGHVSVTHVFGIY